MAAAGQTRQGLVLPRRTRRYRFSMTPLADVMFQLLIFFMLSANIAPYSLLDLRTGGVSGGTPSEAPPETEPGQTTDIRTTAVWTLDATGAIVAGGQHFTADRLPALAEALKLQGTADVLVILRRDVPVQRLVAVLQTLAARGITSVQVAGGGL